VTLAGAPEAANLAEAAAALVAAVGSSRGRAAAAAAAIGQHRRQHTSCTPVAAGQPVK